MAHINYHEQVYSPWHSANARDDSASRHFLLPVELERCELWKFQKRGTCIEQPIYAITGNKFAWNMVNVLWPHIINRHQLTSLFICIVSPPKESVLHLGICRLDLRSSNKIAFKVHYFYWFQKVIKFVAFK